MDAEPFRSAIEAHPKLIVVLAHGGPLSFLAPLLALLRITMGADPGRHVLGTFHPAWWRLPLFRSAARHLTGSVDHFTFQQLERAIGGTDRLDYYALPEAEKCWFGDPVEIKPFRMHGFIELSVRHQVPMVLVVHEGTERWHRALDVSGRLRPLIERLPESAFQAIEFNKEAVLSEIAQRHTINVPLPLARARLRVTAEVHRPLCFGTGLPDEWRERRRAVLEEGERIRARMQALRDAI
jgi:hypothetical protein